VRVVLLVILVVVLLTLLEVMAQIQFFQLSHPQVVAVEQQAVVVALGHS
jgi:hypothetical protein